MRKMSLNEFLFLKWVSKTHPKLYNVVAGDPREALSGFMDSLSQGLQAFLTEAPKVYGQYLQGKQQLDALKLNVERARMNLPPIDPTTGQPITAQTPGYDVPPGVTRGFFDSVPPWAFVAVGALALVFILKK